MSDGAPVDVPGLVRGLRVLRERWWVIALCAVVCVGAALASSLTSPKKYQATSKVLFRNPGLDAAVGGSTSSGSSDPQVDQATNVLLVQTNEIAQAVGRALRLTASPVQLLHQVAATTEQNASIVDVTATDSSASAAARLANTWAQQTVTARQQADRSKVAQGLASISSQLHSLPTSSATDRANLAAAYQKLLVVQAVQTGNAEVIDLAAVPTAPSSPTPKRDGVIGLILGLVLGVALAFLLNLLDRRLKTIEDIESAYGIRTLTSIPERSQVPSTDRERAAALEPFRILRNALGLLSAKETRIILVTSAVPEEGKTTVAAGLARAIALSGQEVCLVEVDLRRPAFRRTFELEDDPRGLTTALVGRAGARELMRPVMPLRSLYVIPSGPLPPNSAELLNSAEMSDLLAELRQEVDFVILDAPPLLPVADAQVLLDHREIDACLVVARANATTRDQVRRARAVLEGHRVSSQGLVVNWLRELDHDYDYYGGSESGDVRLSDEWAGAASGSAHGS